ncbi:LLM class flavin-dependent oxidoreductase [Frankia sp. Ag45/Mut15]|uniref:LLM class flavin-dependent oxidoreductase n=1 Tax=Frankia umida TaxID=573489 RepID=A0ABT0K229_9ACTN|nr:MupA/Atu3671 family FMN-dependent luciferase-like monooxygenase [Frankia umida]MCK9877846.1 LLM class flavin-dependent oxidoreductase [Frankia umida]
MDFSLFYFANDSIQLGKGGRYELLLEGARFADGNDFTAVWTPERHFHPFGGLYPNPAIAGAAVAAATERIAIRAGSVVAALHHPLRIAEDWAVVDNLSAGRVGISFASGWHPVDFALRPDAYAERRQIFVDTVDTVRRLWRGEPLAVVDGKGVRTEVRTFPPPIQRELPFWITTAGNTATFELAGRQGAGLLTHLLGQEPDELAVKIRAYREAHQQMHGGDGHVVLMLHTFLGEHDRIKEVVRDPLCAYLKSSFSLISTTIARGGVTFDPATIQESDVDYLAARGFERFYETGGLFGPVDRALGLVHRLADLGVDEIGCLVDFGVETKAVLDSLDALSELRRQAAGVSR